MLVASIPGRKVAMVSVLGWDGLRVAVHGAGLNPEADGSTVIHAARNKEKDYSGMETMITVMLHRQSGGEWAEDELMPIRSFELLAWAPSGQPCGVKLELKDGRTFLVDHGNPEGNLRS
jgi:hypothetical protein